MKAFFHFLIGIVFESTNCENNYHAQLVHDILLDNHFHWITLLLIRMKELFM